jgi:CheY-like chemotaxis protein
VLAGGIAHDFNNVLQAISGYAQLLQAEKNLSGIGRERLESIERSIERASRMINQLMTLAHKVDTRHERVDLNQEVWQTVDILKHTLPRMISIKTKLEPELKAISGDPGQIEQVLLNLATNAGHAMPQGGELSFATRGVILNGAERNSWPGLPPGEYVALEVADTGQGMDEATQSRIFEPFFTTKPPGEGTGLGLSTAYGIVTSHGGHVQCRSKPGQGTTFSIIFPVAGAKDQQPPGQAVAQAGDLRGSETILLVDDEKPILDSCREALENFGYRVLTASRGEEALEIFLRAPRSIGLVILDLNMPGMGGLDCIKAMLSADPRAKVMVATGYTEVGVSAAILEMGGLGLIPKPYRFTDLLATIRNVLDSGQTQP